MNRENEGAKPTAPPRLPPEAEQEILEALFEGMEIHSSEIAAILKKHGVCGDAEALQDSYEDSRGMFEMMNGHQLMRYLLADQFHAIRWEIIPGTCYERAVLLPIDRTTPAYRAFEQKLYTAILQNYLLNPQKQHDRKEHDTR